MNPNPLIKSLAEIERYILSRKNSPARFRLPFDFATTRHYLEGGVRAEVRLRHHDFVDTDEMRRNVDRATAWLVQGERPGLMLNGSIGSGKTTLLSAIATLINFSAVGKIRTWEAIDLCRLSQADPSTFEKVKRAPLLAIDDLGTEPTTVLSYGNSSNPIVELLTHRYNAQLPTLATTNIAAGIREKYGDRLADRFNEMFEVISFRAKSFRTS